MSELTERLRKSADLAGERWPDTDAMYEAADRLEAMEGLLREAREHINDTSAITGNLVWKSELSKMVARIDTLLGEQ